MPKFKRYSVPKIIHLALNIQKLFEKIIFRNQKFKFFLFSDFYKLLTKTN